MCVCVGVCKCHCVCHFVCATVFAIVYAIVCMSLCARMFMSVRVCKCVWVYVCVCVCVCQCVRRGACLSVYEASVCVIVRLYVSVYIDMYKYHIIKL